MSRSISIFYTDRLTGRDTDIEVDFSRDLLGGQRSSMAFWAIPRLREIGITRLSELGVTDPVYFFDWDGMAELRREIRLLDDHLAEIDFHPETQAAWLCNLLYCYHRLVGTAPRESIPVFSIG